MDYGVTDVEQMIPVLGQVKSPQSTMQGVPIGF